MKRVKIVDCSIGELENKINKFFEDNPKFEVMDILLLHSGETSAILAIFYWTPKQNDSKG